MFAVGYSGKYMLLKVAIASILDFKNSQLNRFL